MNTHVMTPPAEPASARPTGRAVGSGALRAPVIVAPMHLLSGPELVVASCRAGLMGSFPAANARTPAELRRWLTEITNALGAVPDARWAVSMIAHRGYHRFGPELELIAEHRPDVVVTGLGSPRRVVEAVRGYGGAVFAGVCSVEQALKAADAGADGLVLECRTEGGSLEQPSPRVFLDSVRGFFGGPLVVSAGLRDGRGVRAAETLGADLAYVGRRFVACAEARLDDRYGALLTHLHEAGLSATASMAGVPASWLAEGLRGGRLGFAAARGSGPGGRMPGDRIQGGSIPSAARIADRIVGEYLSAVFEGRVGAPRATSE